jgi:hypothetical protein
MSSQKHMTEACNYLHEHHKTDHHHKHAHGEHHSKPAGGGKEPTDKPGVGKLAKEGK